MKFFFGEPVGISLVYYHYGITVHIKETNKQT